MSEKPKYQWAVRSVQSHHYTGSVAVVEVRPAFPSLFTGMCSEISVPIHNEPSEMRRRIENAISEHHDNAVTKAAVLTMSGEVTV